MTGVDAGAPRSGLGLTAIGARLRDAGLTARALAAWAGTARIAALPARIAGMTTRSSTPAGAILALFVGGAEVMRDRLHVPPALIDALIAHALLEADGDRLRARVAIVPLGPALLVCDRLDAPSERARVCWPDDSSHHLATAIPPGRRAHWLDLGCGSAFAPLARPELATRISGVDINARAVAYAQLGAGLSGIAHVVPALGDVGAAYAPAELVTCNAPIPDATAAVEIWRHAEPGFFDRMWPALRRAVGPGGVIVVHGASEAILPVLADAGGERVVVTYTPASVRGFAVAWWRPDALDRFVEARRALTPDRPHVDPDDREEALGG